MLYIVFTLFYSTSFSFSLAPVFQDKVKLEIISEDKSTKKVEFNWPFSHEAPVGGSSVLINEVDKVLKKNGVDCPPKREKISDNIWKCGNGKKIRTDDPRFIKLLSKAWQ